jgi:GxxExxY protein
MLLMLLEIIPCDSVANVLNLIPVFFRGQAHSAVHENPISRVQPSCVAIREKGGRVMEEEDLTFRIRGCAYEVFRVLGFGFLEQVYQQALLRKFALQGVKAVGQAALEVRYKGEPVGRYAADILVDDRIVVELKAAESLTKAHEAQLLNYLKASGKKVGLLINFMHPKAEIRRLVL